MDCLVGFSACEHCLWNSIVHKSILLRLKCQPAWKMQLVILLLALETIRVVAISQHCNARRAVPVHLSIETDATMSLSKSDDKSYFEAQAVTGNDIRSTCIAMQFDIFICRAPYNRRNLWKLDTHT
jgi:hypothetical protein